MEEKVLIKGDFRKIMQIPGWTYYNNAAIQSTPPHIEVNADCVLDGAIWNLEEFRRRSALGSLDE